MADEKSTAEIDHINRTQYELINTFMEYGVGDKEVAQNIVESIANDKIPSLKIIY